MRHLSIIALALIILVCAAPSHAVDDALAFSGLTSVRAIYDVRSGDEKKLQFILAVIRDTLDETLAQNVKVRYVVSMRGPTVKLLVRNRHGDAELQKKTAELINQLNDRSVHLEACGYALDLFGVEPEDLYTGVNAVGNSLNSLIGYQTKGYAIVPMN